MRFSLTMIMIIALLFGGGYWFSDAATVCEVPVAYRLGTIDPRFNISYDEVRTVVSTAEALWEDGTGFNVLTFDEAAPLTINFIFDDRQALTNEAGTLRERLDAKEEMSEVVRAEYEALQVEYETLDAAYETRLRGYETRLAEYNARVQSRNDEGGAPPDEFKKLEAELTELRADEAALNRDVTKLNALVREMNDLGKKGNTLISDYNETANEYNDRFAEPREFAQGDYTGTEINIYQYETRDELIIVLAHEFGHALGIDHVEGETSMMYYLMEEQSLARGITESDRMALQEACRKPSGFTERLHAALERLGFLVD